MYRLDCDYSEGCHPKILEALVRSNMEQHPGYGQDDYCAAARKWILRQLEGIDADVHFLLGGTQANATVISAILRPHQGVLCAETAHINSHETGAIEALGHKVLAMRGREGKISAQDVDAYCDIHYADPGREHTVQPGMVYVSQPTETGMLYTLDELRALRGVCQRYGMMLYVDGARLGYGLASPINNTEMAHLAALCDAFTIGGTKVGALFGEAVVIMNPELKKDFRYFIKQQGGMLAKGRLLGVQFTALMQGGLYQEVAKQAVWQAMRIREAFLKRGVALRYDSMTNQQFPILSTKERESFAEKYVFGRWDDPITDLATVRICTSWATPDEVVDTLVEDILRICQR